MKEEGNAEKMEPAQMAEIPGAARVRRIGSVTLGFTLVCYGILFLVHIFMPQLHYELIFRCWPVIFILLGIEVLVENHRCKNKEQRFVYDFPAVLMLGITLLFAMVMALLEYESVMVL